VRSALTETENWDLLVDCTSRDGRQMLDERKYLKKINSLLSLKSVFDFTLERSKKRQDKFESILEIIESGTRKIAQYFRFAEKSGDNHPKHFRKLII
jgi:DNA transposition AAA+ family ATPase